MKWLLFVLQHAGNFSKLFLTHQNLKNQVLFSFIKQFVIHFSININFMDSLFIDTNCLHPLNGAKLFFIHSCCRLKLREAGCCEKNLFWAYLSCDIVLAHFWWIFGGIFDSFQTQRQNVIKLPLFLPILSLSH